MDKNTRTILLALGAIVAAAFLWWAYLGRSDFAHEEVRVLPGSAPPPPSSAPAPSTATAPAAPTLDAPLVNAAPCREQPLNITIKDRSSAECFGSTVVLQNGSLRSYRVDGTQHKGWELKIDAIAEQVQSAQLVTGDNLTFGCAEGRCSGITISKHDSQGVRTLTLSRALLRQSSGAPIAEDIAQRVAHVDGKLRTLPEAQVPGMACPGQGVSIVSNDGGTTALCPNGGAGFEMLDDGGRRFEFSGVDAGTIYVTVDTQELVKKVEFDNGTLACSGAECGGLAVSPPNEKGERRFAFSNTTLRHVVQDGTPSGRFVTITGTLVLPGDL